MRSLLTCCVLLLASCSAEPTNPGGAAAGGGSGFLYFGRSVDLEIHKISLASGEDVKLGKGDHPFSTKEGTLIFATPLDLAESDETLASHRIIVQHTTGGTDKHSTGFNAPQLSPDGTKIVYTTVEANLYVVSRADGAVLQRHEHKGVTEAWHHPTWTPDGRIVVGGGFGNQGLYLSDASLSTFTRFDPNLAYPRDPDVSPDGTKVVFALNDRLHVINIDGTGLKRIDQSNDDAAMPEFSPDGQKVIYRVSGRIKIISADGAGRGDDLFDIHPSLKDKFFVMSGSPLHWK
jgi:hypothetical protein